MTLFAVILCLFSMVYFIAGLAQGRGTLYPFLVLLFTTLFLMS